MSKTGQGVTLWVLTALFAGCATLEHQAKKVRTEETVLFDGIAHVGFVLNTGDRISWEGAMAVPVLATPTTLYYGTNARAYTSLESVEVTTFHAAKELFIKATTYEDLLIVKERQGWKRVFKFVPSTKNLKSPLGSQEQRALAESLANVIEAQQRSVDLFGRIRSPRSVWLATNPGLVYEFWSVQPRYLDAHFRTERQAIDALFKSTRGTASSRFAQGMRPLLLKGGTQGNGYTFVDAGEVKMDWLRHKKIAEKLGERDQKLDSLVLLDHARIFLEEKMDPQGNPSIRARFASTARFYDLENARLASYESFDHETTLALRDWLDGGQERILSEMEKAMEKIARKLEASLNIRS